MSRAGALDDNEMQSEMKKMVRDVLPIAPCGATPA
jgi:hypothetical protein